MRHDEAWKDRLTTLIPSRTACACRWQSKLFCFRLFLIDNVPPQHVRRVSSESHRVLRARAEAATFPCDSRLSLVLICMYLLLSKWINHVIIRPFKDRNKIRTAQSIVCDAYQFADKTSTHSRPNTSIVQFSTSVIACYYFISFDGNRLSRPPFERCTR